MACRAAAMMPMLIAMIRATAMAPATLRRLTDGRFSPRSPPGRRRSVVMRPPAKAQGRADRLLDWSPASDMRHGFCFGGKTTSFSSHQCHARLPRAARAGRAATTPPRQAIHVEAAVARPMIAGAAAHAFDARSSGTFRWAPISSALPPPFRQMLRTAASTSSTNTEVSMFAGIAAEGTPQLLSRRLLAGRSGQVAFVKREYMLRQQMPIRTVPAVGR